MSTICLICKDKLLNTLPGSSLGSLNSIVVENQVVAVLCGHAYHQECMRSWFLTQKKKLQNQGITGQFPDHCPTCQAEVHEEHIRRLFLLEDHRDALEKAKMLEKMENLEIYCHQLEIHVQRLQQENDLLINKALSPTTPVEEFSTIVKNDRVVWLKKESPPLSGMVLSIFKKEGALWVKLKLDKKIRTNQRSGLLGSFRFDKKQEVTVLFEEIVLEKDYKKNNIIHENPSMSAPPTPSTTTLPPHKIPSFRSSTMSLPGDYTSKYYTVPERVRPISAYDFIPTSGSTMELSTNSPFVDQSRINHNVMYNGDSLTSVATEDTIPGSSQSISNTSEQRDYVIFNPASAKYQQQSQQDVKSKHVTFADDLEKRSSGSPKLLENNCGDYTNVVAAAKIMAPTDYSMQLNSPPIVPNRPPITETMPLNISVVDEESAEETEETEDGKGKLSVSKEDKLQNIQVPSIHLIEPSVCSTPSTATPITTPVDLQSDVFMRSFEENAQFQRMDVPENAPESFNRSCFDITFTVLFYECKVFDKAMLLRDSQNDQIQHLVQKILKSEFVNPLRGNQQYVEGYSTRLHETISHLCSSHLDLEELMTILFEYIFKMPPFISYSYDMCDYIHQFFIDFTDKAKKPTVQQLFERSLSLQDNLKLHGEPNPGLILQMPNSEEGIIHYEAVIPSLNLNIEQLLEKDTAKPDACYCNKIATLECSTCAQVHGKSPVLFCDDCSVLLEAIHDQMYHKLELAPIKALDIPRTSLDLIAIICLKADSYSTFLRDVKDGEERSRWVHIERFDGGKPQIDELPNFDKWIESITADVSQLDINCLDGLKKKLLTECRMFLYLPAQNSFA